jgi:two-component system, chemotaxis family, protein-glutamate methylesterase/glutaminase
VPPVVHNRDIIVIGASAGGLHALQTLVAALPPDLPAAVIVKTRRTLTPAKQR